MNTFSKLALVAAIAATPLLANARDTDDNNNSSGPYIGAEVGRFNLHIKHLDGVDDATADIVDSNHDAWKAFVGYRFIPWLSLEAAYVDFGQPNNNFSATGSDGNYRVRLHGFEPSLVASAPLGPVELFAKAGEYYYNVDTRVDFDGTNSSISSSHSRNDFAWGGGLAVVIVHHLELRAEYEKIEIQDAPHSDALWLGAAWRF